MIHTVCVNLLTDICILLMICHSKVNFFNNSVKCYITLHSKVPVTVPILHGKLGKGCQLRKDAPTVYLCFMISYTISSNN